MTRHQESEFINNSLSERAPEAKCKPGQVVSFSDADIKGALNYFFRKCTLEIKHLIQ